MAPDAPRLIAVTREVSPALARCQLTHLRRTPIDPAAAAAQHREYEARLAGLGCTLVRIPADPDLPDCVFVEDTAVVLDEVAVITRPGAPARRPETPAVASVLARYRSLVRIEPPATLDGGDVLVLGRTVYVGRSGRTNREGIAALRDLLAPHGYRVAAVPVRGCLHLKSAAVPLAPDRVLANPAWVDPEAFAGAGVIEIDPGEPFAANALAVGRAVILPAAFPRTRDRLAAAGLAPVTVDVSELAKAEGGVTCCSLVFTG